jgi:Protein of unknown function (DUF2891)
MFLEITHEQAKDYATLALNGLQREYPNKITHLLNTSNDIGSPRTLHPAFYGCWDVHSSIHGHWLVICVLRLFPDHELAPDIRRIVGENLSESNILIERSYFEAPNRQAFERPYGWVWILKLHAEINAFVVSHPGDTIAITWGDNLKSLSQYIVVRLCDFWGNARHPNRVGHVSALMCRPCID